MAHLRRAGRQPGDARPTFLGFRPTTMPVAAEPDLDDPRVAAKYNAHLHVEDLLEDEPWIRRRWARAGRELAELHRGNHALVDAHRSDDESALALLHAQTPTPPTPKPEEDIATAPSPTRRKWAHDQAAVKKHAVAVAGRQENRNRAALQLGQAADDVARDLEPRALQVIEELVNYTGLANTERTAIGNTPLPSLPEDLADRLVVDAMTRPAPISPRSTR
jgi:hypothetical protein